MQLSEPKPLTLSGGPYTAVLAPAAGGRVASLEWRRDGVGQALLVEWDGAPFDEHAWPKAGAFPMLPFANRAPRSGFVVDGRRCRPVPGPDGFAVHGFGHRRPWTVVEASAERAVMALRCRAGDQGWLWDWSATQEIRLHEAGMQVTIRLRNESAHTMPVNLGWHPYHPLVGVPQTGDLWHDASARFDLDEEGRAVAHAAPPVFDHTQGGTASFFPWSGHLRLQMGSAGTLRVETTPGIAVVMHRPANGESYFCAEPVTSLPGQTRALAPGAEHRLDWCCRFEPARA